MTVCQNIKLHINNTDATDDQGLYIIDGQPNKSMKICLICVIRVPTSHYDTLP